MQKQTQVFQIDPGNPDKDKIKQAAQILKNGGVLAFPTDTVYGLAALAGQELALEKLRYIKKRNEEKKFSLCIHDLGQMIDLGKNIPPLAYKLAAKFWPGPLTLVLEAKDGDTVGVRIPDHPVARLLLKEAGAPVFAPSANFAGEPPALSAEEVMRAFSGKIDAVIDSGRVKIGISSTVCRVSDESFELIREGTLSRLEIEKIAKLKKVLFVCTGNSCRSAMAEGMMNQIVRQNENMQIASAGVAAFEGMPASPEAVEVMKKYGVDISRHRARRLTQSMVQESDIILVMENGHRNFILGNFRVNPRRIFLLKEFAPAPKGNFLIPDPIGREFDFYEEVAQTLKKSIEGLVNKLA